jgi:hypothetical protein
MGVELGLSHWGRNIGWGCSRTVLRKMFGPRSDTVMGDWRKLHKEKRHNSYSHQTLFRRSYHKEWDGRVWGRRDVHTGVWWGNLILSPLGRPRHRWDDNIKVDLHETILEDVDWIPLAQLRDEWQAHVNTIMALRILQNTGNYLTSRGTINFSRRALSHAVKPVKYIQILLRNLWFSMERYLMWWVYYTLAYATTYSNTAVPCC